MKPKQRQGRSITKTTTTTTTTTVKRAPNKPRNNGGGGQQRHDVKRPGRRRPEGRRPGPQASTQATPDTTQQAVQVEQPRFTTVNFRVHEVECIKTTREIDRDEIVLAAIKVEGKLGGTEAKRKLAGKAEKGEQLSVGKFSKGDSQKYPKTRVLARYDVGGGVGNETRFFVGALVLIEEDEGHIGAVLNSVVKSVEKEVAIAISTAAATATSAALAGVAAGSTIGSSVPLLGTAIGAAAGAAVGVAFGEIKSARADDVFPPKKAVLELDRMPDEAGEIPGSRKTYTFKGFKGEYKVVTSWAVR